MNTFVTTLTRDLTCAAAAAAISLVAALELRPVHHRGPHQRPGRCQRRPDQHVPQGVRAPDLTQSMTERSRP